jgi:PAS domain S-box-containing protein
VLLGEIERLKRELESREQLFRSLVETTSDWIWESDRDGIFTYSSPKVKDLLGYDAEEVVGNTLFCFMPASEAERIRPLVRQIVEGKAPFERLETKTLRRDGRWIILETNGIPVLDAQGNLRAYRGISRDITERQRAEQEIRESGKRYQTLLSAVTTYTYTVRLENGMPVATDHSAGCISATGYSPEDYLRDPWLWFRMVHPDDRQKVQQLVAEIHSGSEVPPVEHRIFHKDGSTRWIRTTIVRHRDESDRLIRYDGVVEDITDRKAAQLSLLRREAQLLAAQKIQSHLWPSRAPELPGYDISGASHPAEFAGGDHFDYFIMDDGTLIFFIGDVSGHDLGSALLMALASERLRTLAEMRLEVGEILSRTNTAFVKEVQCDRFITLLFGKLNPGTGTLVYTNAGHPAGYVLDGAGNVQARLESSAFPLGILPDTVFPQQGPLCLEPGGMILLVTDGVLEARSPDGSDFGTERTLEVARENRHKSAAEIVDRLSGAVHLFSEGGDRFDDVTVVVIKATPVCSGQKPGSRPVGARARSCLPSTASAG